MTMLRLWRERARIAFVMVACSLPVADATAAGAEPERLAALVRQDCGSCHGLTLKGGLGKPLTPEHLQQWDVDQVTRIILDGVPGTPMPPWRPLLGENDARWIAERLKQGTLP